MGKTIDSLTGIGLGIFLIGGIMSEPAFLFGNKVFQEFKKFYWDSKGIKYKREQLEDFDSPYFRYIKILP